MSDALYSTRLRWANGHGVAMLHGRAVCLTAPPVLCGVAVAAVDYTPEVHCLEVRRHPSDRMEDMTPAEVADADALLRQLVGDFSPT